MMRKLLLYTVFAICLLTSCQRGYLYCHSTDLPTKGWHQDSILSFAYAPIDSLQDYSIRFVVRHNGQYPYQNLWMFVKEYRDSFCTHIDTIECSLADDFGRWHGRGVHVYELELIYEEPVRYGSGNYSILIEHGMREEILKGILSVGVDIVEY